MAVGVALGVAVWVGVKVGVGVAVGVSVGAGVAVGELVGLALGVGVMVGCAVAVGVDVSGGVAVAVGLCVGVGVTVGACNVKTASTVAAMRVASASTVAVNTDEAAVLCLLLAAAVWTRVAVGERVAALVERAVGVEEGDNGVACPEVVAGALPPAATVGEGGIGWVSVGVAVSVLAAVTVGVAVSAGNGLGDAVGVSVGSTGMTASATACVWVGATADEATAPPTCAGVTPADRSALRSAVELLRLAQDQRMTTSASSTARATPETSRERERRAGGV